MNKFLRANRYKSLMNLPGILNLAIRTIEADVKQYRHQNRGDRFAKRRLLGTVFARLDRPIFLVGSPRSGTTFLGKSLAHLSGMSYHFEPILTKAASRYVYEGLWSFEKAKFLYEQTYIWLMRIHGEGSLKFCEKTPRNCFLIDFLACAFPDSQFIHIIRDGRDVALSYSKKPWLQAAQANSGKHEPGGYPYGPYARFWVESERVGEFETTSDIHRCIWAWRRFTQSARSAGTRLCKSRYYELRYEALVFQPEKESDRLLDFLEIGDKGDRQRFQQATAQVTVDSVGRWRRELSSEQLEQIDREAGDLLAQLNY